MVNCGILTPSYYRGKWVCLSSIFWFQKITKIGLQNAPSSPNIRKKLYTAFRLIRTELLREFILALTPLLA